MSKLDEKIKKGVVDSFFWDSRLDASNVKVEVDNREVTLRGTVANYSASEAALFDAWSVRGVTKVDNQLLIKFPTEVNLPNDEEIRSNIENILGWNDSTRGEEIIVTVKNRNVALDGNVGAYWKKLRAEQIVRDVTGVAGITNRLAVVLSDAIVDSVIAEDIVKAIDRNYTVDIEDVDVRVKDGSVTLSGEIPNRIAAEAALDAARNTLGVREVTNRLVIG